MTLQYGLTLENEAFIIKKAGSKRDGCFQIRGVAYRVRSGKVTHFANGNQVLERCYGFNCIVGSYEGGSDNALLALKLFRGYEDGR